MSKKPRIFRGFLIFKILSFLSLGIQVSLRSRDPDHIFAQHSGRFLPVFRLLQRLAEYQLGLHFRGAHQPD